jgi:hypothetical protein
MASGHLTINSETEMRQFLSEKSEMQGGVTKVTLTSSLGFVAKNLSIYDREVL